MIMFSRIVTIVCCWILGIILFWSGVTHLMSPNRFMVTVFKYEFIGGWAASAASILIAPLQIAISLFLLSMRNPKCAAFAAAGLLLVFTAAISYVLVQGIMIDCGCFGASKNAISSFTLLRNIGLIVLCALAAYAPCLESIKLKRSHQ